MTPEELKLQAQSILKQEMARPPLPAAANGLQNQTGMAKNILDKELNNPVVKNSAEQQQSGGVVGGIGQLTNKIANLAESGISKFNDTVGEGLLQMNDRWGGNVNSPAYQSGLSQQQAAIQQFKNNPRAVAAANNPQAQQAAQVIPAANGIMPMQPRIGEQRQEGLGKGGTGPGELLRAYNRNTDTLSFSDANGGTGVIEGASAMAKPGRDLSKPSGYGLSGIMQNAGLQSAADASKNWALDPRQAEIYKRLDPNSPEDQRVMSIMKQAGVSPSEAMSLRAAQRQNYRDNVTQQMLDSAGNKQLSASFRAQAVQDVAAGRQRAADTDPVKMLMENRRAAAQGVQAGQQQDFENQMKAAQLGIEAIKARQQGQGQQQAAPEMKYIAPEVDPLSGKTIKEGGAFDPRSGLVMSQEMLIANMRNKAMQDVKAGIITPEEFKMRTGQDYTG